MASPAIRADPQEDLVAAFAAGDVEGAPAPVERIDTHLSYVFLSGERAFKLKRAVSFPFVDFSRCEQRRLACAAELDANRAMAGDLYCDALPVTRRPKGFRIGGDGEIVDWVVVMRRFDQAQQFDHLAQAGQLSRELVEEAVEALARVHAETPSTEHAGQAAEYRRVIRELRETEADGARRLGLEPGAPLLFERLEFELTRVSGLIEQRRRDGKVRRGHGDLHLRNLCVFEGRAIAFDALEFDARLATTDPLYDLAFLLMDLRRVGLPAHANAAMNRYWDAAQVEEAALEVLPFFMGLRAGVRMAVAVEAGALLEAQAYRALGLQLLTRDEARLVAIGGLSGTGKTVVAQALAPRLAGPAGARVLRSDVLRKHKYSLKLEEKAAPSSYGPAERAEIYRELATKAAAAVASGASVIADATFSANTTREAIAAAAQSAHFKAYWLTAALATRLARVAGRARDASDADVAVAAAQDEPRDIQLLWRRLDANRPVAAIVTDILQDCGA